MFFRAPFNLACLVPVQSALAAAIGRVFRVNRPADRVNVPTVSPGFYLRFGLIMAALAKCLDVRQVKEKGKGALMGGYVICYRGERVSPSFTLKKQFY